MSLGKGRPSVKVAGATEESSREWVFWRLARSILGGTERIDSRDGQNSGANWTWVLFLGVARSERNEMSRKEISEILQVKVSRSTAGKRFSTAILQAKKRLLNEWGTTSRQNIVYFEILLVYLTCCDQIYSPNRNLLSSYEYIVQFYVHPCMYIGFIV